MKYLYEVSTDLANIIVLINFIIINLLNIHLVENALSLSLIIFLIVKILFEISVKVLLYMRVKRIEKAWNRSSISKISSG